MADAAMKLNKIFSLLFLLILLTISSTSMAAEELSFRDLNAAIFTLRSNGYNLFANAIAVSDLSFQMLTVSSAAANSTTFNGVGGGGGSHGYTLLAPPNSALFSLDMSTDAFTYVHSLRVHVIPRRLSISDLRNISLSSEPYLETLAPGNLIAVASSGDVFSIDGVLVTLPDMHLRPNIAVHGLDGILLSSAVRVEDLGFVTAPQPFAGAFSPQIAEVPSPVAAFSPEIGVPSPVNSFTVGSGFGSVSIPPTGFFSPEFADTPTPTPSPIAACSEWSGCEIELLSPYIWPPPPTSGIPPMTTNLPPPQSSIFPPTLSTPPTLPPQSPLPHSPQSQPAISSNFAPPQVKDTAREWWQSGEQVPEKNKKTKSNKNKHHHHHNRDHHDHHHHREIEEGEEAAEYVMKKRDEEAGRDEESHGYGLGWRVEQTQNYNHDYDHLNFAKYNQENTLPPPQNWW